MSPSQENRSHPGPEGHRQEQGHQSSLMRPWSSVRTFQVHELAWMASDFAVGPLPLPTPGEDAFMVLGHVTGGIRSSACQILS